ncbi:MAG: hypothetical protein D4R68_02810 [Ignavibacteriales bacterium]|nr:MAG: hypothetical protein D4R68_02810 [Ignavibacteriales bacterium]
MKKIISAFLIFSLVSCDLLTTRDPEQPNTAGNSNIPATSPDILFNNFKSSIQDKILENYLACFVDPSFSNRKYKFIAAAGLVSQYPVLIGWNLDSEIQYFKNMKARSKDGQSITLTLSNGNNTQLGDSAVYQYDYSLSFLANDQPVSSEYKGSVQFKIYQESSLWVIGEWYDLRKDNFSSWSELKGSLY